MPPKAAIYDPYLDTLGGGERYSLTLAEALLARGYLVDLLWSGDRDIISRAESRFNLSLSGVNITPDIFSSPIHSLDLIEEKTCLLRFRDTCLLPPPQPTQKFNQLINKYKATRQYDLFFYLSDGSLPYLFSKNNFVHIQVPFIQHFTPFQQINSQLKLLFINKIICNSEFTRKIISSYFPLPKTTVIYPPVDVDQFQTGPKQPIILSVGRFDNILNVKKQDVLIQSFISLRRRYSKASSWQLYLAGGSLDLPQENHYLLHLQKQANGHPIKFFVNPDFATLRQLYATATIYWHAAGFEVDEINHPQQAEHFGITVVEAQASGTIPIVVAKGGLIEIITHGQNGFLWHTPDDLINQTIELINQPNLCHQLSPVCQASSQKYSKSNFISKFFSLV